MTRSSYRMPPLQRTCISCQRCPRHCFHDRDCRMAMHREVCLTCSNAVFFVIGVDLSRERANEQGKNPAKSRVSKTPNGRPQAFADAPAPNPVRPSADGEESILPDLTDHGA